MKRLLVAVFVALLVVQPATAAAYPSAAAACGQTGGGEVLIGILPGASTPNDRQVLQGRTQLYSGTTFRLALCKDGELKPTRGSEWSLESSPGLEVLDRTDSTVTVRVTGEMGRIDVPKLVSGKESLDGVSVVVRSAPTADSALVEGTITFDNASAASTYRATERAYLGALSNLSNATARLNESAAALDSGDAEPATVTEEVLPALNRSRKAVRARGKTVEDRLYGTAWQSKSGSNALAALAAAQTRERATEREAKRAMRNYLSQLEAAERDARATALVNIGGAAVAGLVVGAVPGWWLTASRLEDIRFDRQVNASVSYSPSVLLRAGGLALAALVLTLGGLVVLGGLGTLGGLL